MISVLIKAICYHKSFFQINEVGKHEIRILVFHLCQFPHDYQCTNKQETVYSDRVDKSDCFVSMSTYRLDN